MILFCLCFIPDFGFHEAGDDEGLIVLSAAAGLFYAVYFIIVDQNYPQ